MKQINHSAPALLNKTFASAATTFSSLHHSVRQSKLSLKAGCGMKEFYLHINC